MLILYLLKTFCLFRLLKISGPEDYLAKIFGLNRDFRHFIDVVSTKKEKKYIFIYIRLLYSAAARKLKLNA